MQSVRLRRADLAMGFAALAIAGLVMGYAAVLSLEGITIATDALLAVLLAAAISSIAGFAFSALCGVLLLQIISDPVQVMQVMLVCSIAIQTVSVAALWRDVDWPRVAVFVSGGVAGLPIGLWLLLHLDHFWIRHTLGAVLIGYAILKLLRWNRQYTSSMPLIDLAVGCLGGVTGGLAAFPGAAVTMWCGMRGWDKRRQRGVCQPFILIMQLLSLLLMTLLHSPGAHAANGGMALLLFVPPALLGTWMGLVVFNRLADSHFAMAVNLLLLVAGIGLMA